MTDKPIPQLTLYCTPKEHWEHKQRTLAALDQHGEDLSRHFYAKGFDRYQKMTTAFDRDLPYAEPLVDGFTNEEVVALAQWAMVKFYSDLEIDVHCMEDE